VFGLAADVLEWQRALGVTPDAVLGHSFGGKVALAMAAQGDAAPLQVWVIDSTPDVKTPSGSAWAMLDLVRRLPGRFATREEAVQAIVAGGYSEAVARWMATNLAREGDHFAWQPDFDVMETLLRDFFATDLWRAVESPGPAHEIHFLKASESSVLTPEAVQRIEAADRQRVHLHERQGGHWIHAESPQVVADLLLAHLP
jgi:pimeloyl-ACP methyl ester carboxylesterase